MMTLPAGPIGPVGFFETAVTGIAVRFHSDLEINTKALPFDQNN